MRAGFAINPLVKVPLHPWLFLLLCFATFQVRAQVVTASLSVAFTNPAPSYDAQFGSSVAGVGTDKVAMGGYPYGSNVVHLYGTNGTLLATLMNPNPQAFGQPSHFGFALAGFGPDKLIVGAPRDDAFGINVGAAYLFNAAGGNVTTYSRSQTPGMGVQGFGYAVASVGTNRILIGAPFASITKSASGAAFLFSADGVLLTTFTNPVPSMSANFGNAATAIDADRVVITAYREELGGRDNLGGAFIFSTSGVLLTAITNPVFDLTWFGWAVAATTDKILVSAPLIGDVGIAYLFSTNGTLMHTITNPTPRINDKFGYSVAAVGGDKFLIGGQYGAAQDGYPGAAYLYSSNGTLLKTITNPTPEYGDSFGWAVAALGSGQIIIGANYDNTGAHAAGAAYLYALTYSDVPNLKFDRIGGNLLLSWPRPSTGFVLETTTGLAAPPGTNVWTQVPLPYQTNATEISVTVTPATNQFFRLHQP